MLVTARLGLGTAALGRPGYITLGHAHDLERRYGVAAMEQHCHGVLDEAWRCGVRWFDVARSYGRAEEFVASWLAARAIDPADVTISSKWGYSYVANWQVEAAHHEIKDHSLTALDAQLPESRRLLGSYLAIYQVHSVTPESPLLSDRAALARLGELRDAGLRIGLSLSGPRQRETLERALEIVVSGRPLWSAVQATWSLFERSVGPALVAAKRAGLTVMIKEAVANGRLVERLGAGGDMIAIAAALAQPFSDVVLSGAATPSQLASNARARELDGAALAARYAALIEAPELYWATRARLAWN
ncbi:aldo/keto reductase [soil metagenome]